MVGDGNGFPPPNLMGRFEAGGDCFPPVIASPATSGVMNNTPQGTPLGTLQVIFGAFVGCRNPIPDNPRTHKSIPPCAAPAHTPTPPLRIGPMFSGKSTELTRRMRRHKVARRKCIVIKYAGDTRYEDEPGRAEAGTGDAADLKGCRSLTVTLLPLRNESTALSGRYHISMVRLSVRAPFCPTFRTAVHATVQY